MLISYQTDYETAMRYEAEKEPLRHVAEITSPKAFGNQPPRTITYTHPDHEAFEVHYPDHATHEIMGHAHYLADKGFKAHNLADVLSHDPGKPPAPIIPTQPTPTHIKATEKFLDKPLRNWLRFAWHNTALGSHLNPHASYKYLDTPIRKINLQQDDEEDEKAATSRLALLLRPKMASHE